MHWGPPKDSWRLEELFLGYGSAEQFLDSSLEPARETCYCLPVLGDSDHLLVHLFLAAGMAHFVGTAGSYAGLAPWRSAFR